MTESISAWTGRDADKQALENAIIRDDGRVVKDRDAIEWATNAGSLRLWGSSAYARMDRADAVRMGYDLGDMAPRMLAIGVIDAEAAAISTGRDPRFGIPLHTIINRDGTVA